jgi:thioredoxin reductase
MDATMLRRISERLRKGEQLLLILLPTQCLLAVKYCVVRCDTAFFVWSEVSILHAYSTLVKLSIALSEAACRVTHS